MTIIGGKLSNEFIPLMILKPKRRGNVRSDN